MHKIIYILVFTVSLLKAQETPMTASEILSFKHKVKTTASKTNTIISDFIQYKHLDFLSNDIKTLGKMTFKKPNLVKWSYTNPFQYSVIFKKDKLLINDQGKKSAVKIGTSPLFKKLNHLIVNSIRGTMFNDIEFNISYTKSSNYYHVTFLSKDKELKKYIKQFVLTFNKEAYFVTEVKMIEPSDDYTQIIFKNRKENKIVNDAIFSN